MQKDDATIARHIRDHPPMAGECFPVAAVSRAIAKRLGWGRRVWMVWLHAEVLRHIEQRRGIVAPTVVGILDAVVSDPALVGFERSSRQRLLMIGPDGAHEQFAVAVKVVAVEPRGRTLWVSTAFPVSARSLRRLRRRHSLFRVE